MINHVWTVLCQGSSIDEETNTPSLFQILEHITIMADDPCPEDLIIPIQFEIFSLWVRQNQIIPARGKARVFYCYPNQSCSKTAQFDLDLSSKIFHRTRVKSQGIKVSGSGVYYFYVEMQMDGEEEWHRIATLPILVDVNTLPKEAPPSQE